MASSEITWVRYTWSLDDLVDDEIVTTSGDFIRHGSPREADVITELVLAAYSSDPIWHWQLEQVQNRLRYRIGGTLGSREVKYIVAEHSGAIVGVSGVARRHITQQNLLTGPCVAAEHRGRGFGTRLLLVSLIELRRMGLSKARVYTAANSIADRRLYPKFGSVREPGVSYAATLSELR